MVFESLKQARRVHRKLLAGGPLALIFDEDGVELQSTVEHHLDLGFQSVVVFSSSSPSAPLPEPAVHIACPPLSARLVAAQVTEIAQQAKAGTWIYWGYNAEFLHYPFCETRCIADCLAFHASERREAMLTPVIDLYAPDLAAAPSGVDRRTAHFDGAGYYALARPDHRERQLDLFGGLRWRFEEWVPEESRRIDRIALFRASPKRTLTERFTFTEEELNTYACPWHHNLTATVASFRAAKALRHNPGSRQAVQTMMWEWSVPFNWSSSQLMEHGFMEPGQWI